MRFELSRTDCRCCQLQLTAEFWKFEGVGGGRCRLEKRTEVGSTELTLPGEIGRWNETAIVVTLKLAAAVAQV